MGPRGFLFSTAEAAIKKSGRKDIALIVSEVEARIAGTFTTNSAKAAPVTLCMRKIRSGRGQAVIVNSGNANACTGKQGAEDVRKIVSRAARQLRIKSSLIYPCSTGVIGVPMPMDRILPAVDSLTRDIGTVSFDDVARAIMTTDSFPKVIHKKIKIGSKVGTVAGICKGAGMIAPHMATMLCFILTDISIDRKTMSDVLKESVSKSFNRITVDGDMSTNDTVLMMSNGMLGNSSVTRQSPYFQSLKKTLDTVTYELAKMVVRDGEGATKLVEVLVKSARRGADAEMAAFAIANSLLVKTALYGNDANWGRIMAAIGASGIPFDVKKTDIYFNRVKVVRAGMANNKDTEANAALRSRDIRITVDFHAGRSSASVLTCDLSETYVRVNAEYRT